MYRGPDWVINDLLNAQSQLVEDVYVCSIYSRSVRVFLCRSGIFLRSLTVLSFFSSILLALAVFVERFGWCLTHFVSALPGSAVYIFPTRQLRRTTEVDAVYLPSSLVNFTQISTYKLIFVVIVKFSSSRRARCLLLAMTAVQRVLRLMHVKTTMKQHSAQSV